MDAATGHADIAPLQLRLSGIVIGSERDMAVVMIPAEAASCDTVGYRCSGTARACPPFCLLAPSIAWTFSRLLGFLPNLFHGSLLHLSLPHTVQTTFDRRGPLCLQASASFLERYPCICSALDLLGWDGFILAHLHAEKPDGACSLILSQ